MERRPHVAALGVCAAFLLSVSALPAAAAESRGWVEDESRGVNEPELGAWPPAAGGGRSLKQTPIPPNIRYMSKQYNKKRPLASSRHPRPVLDAAVASAKANGAKTQRDINTNKYNNNNRTMTIDGGSQDSVRGFESLQAWVEHTRASGQHLPLPVVRLQPEEMGPAKERIATVPRFLMIGAQKGGTTNLRYNLLQHPQLDGAINEVRTLVLNSAELQRSERAIRPPLEGKEGGEDDSEWRHAQKELQQRLSHELFEKTYTPYLGTPSTYLSPTEAKRREASVFKGETFLFASSPEMVWKSQVPYLIKDMMPNIKMLFVVRDPVERYFSSHRMHICRGGQKHIERAYHKAGEHDVYLSTVSTEYEPYQEKCKGQNATAADLGACWKAAQQFSPVTRGIYAEQLERYYSIFDRSQILVVNSDRLFTHFLEELDIVVDFLGLQPFDFSYVSKKEPGGGDGKRCEQILHRQSDYVDAMSTRSTKEALREFYRPHNERFFALTGVDYGWNDSPAEER